jgi:hypothetical protein
VTSTNQLLDKVEDAGLWAYFHKDWLLEIRTALRRQLPREYHLFVESESILVTPEGETPPAPILPDLAVARAPGPQLGQAAAGGSAAVIEVIEEVELVTKYSLLIRRAPDNRIVAALELLSPSNKGLSSRLDREKYLRKRDDYLQSGINLLEVDALRRGQRLFPPGLAQLGIYERNAWTAVYAGGRRALRGFGWNAADDAPAIPWTIEESTAALVDLNATIQSASDFNRWPDLVAARSD